MLIEVVRFWHYQRLRIAITFPWVTEEVYEKRGWCCSEYAIARYCDTLENRGHPELQDVEKEQQWPTDVEGYAALMNGENKVNFTSKGDRVVVQFNFFKMCLGPGWGQVSKYKGFRETACRLVFPYETKFEGRTPDLLTILPNGVIENWKKLEPKEGQGLIAYTYAQFTSEDLAQKQVDKDGSQWKGTEYCKTPFVDYYDGKCYVVQTWPTRFNKDFKESFQCVLTNPNRLQFEEAAVETFRECVETLFGAGATQTAPILYCTKVTTNESPCYVGTTQALKAYFDEHYDAMKEVGIKEFLSDSSFMSEGKDGKEPPERIEKEFKMKRGTKYVIYKKTGWETMGCCKPWEQFANESEFIGLSVE